MYVCMGWIEAGKQLIQLDLLEKEKKVQIAWSVVCLGVLAEESMYYWLIEILKSIKLRMDKRSQKRKKIWKTIRKHVFLFHTPKPKSDQSSGIEWKG